MHWKLFRILLGLWLTLGLSAGIAAAQGLRVKSVGSVLKGNSTQVTVVFTAPVEDASGTNPNNYVFPAGITVTGVSLINNLPAPDAIGIAENTPPTGRNQNNSIAVLTVTGLTPGTVTSITVRNVRSRADANVVVAEETKQFKASEYRWTETGQLGKPAGDGKTPGHVVSLADENGDIGFDIYSNGGQQWANYDEVTFVYKEVTGDFDFKARVEFADFSSRWGRSGIMARESLNENMPNPPTTAEVTEASRYVSMHSNPVRAFSEAAAGMLAGNNQFESHIRSEVGAQTGSTAGGTPLYPNAWVRIQRTGDTITTYRGEDGLNWDQHVERIVDPPWNPKLFVGPAYSPETQDGNISPANGTEVKSRLFLTQIRFRAIDFPYVSSFAGSPGGFTMEITDAGSAINPATVQVQFDGASVTGSANISKSGGITRIAYTTPAPLTAGSSHTVVVTATDSTSVQRVYERSFVVQQYVNIPPDFAVPPGSVDKNKPGFRVRTVQADRGLPNTNARSEQHLAGELGDNTGTPGPEPDGSYIETGVLDYWDTGGTGNFDTGLAYPGVSGDNFSLEALTFIEFKAPGLYTMGVNSDDGFAVFTGKDFRDRFDKGTLLGEYNGGRGVADTTFVFYVGAPGIYPFRLTHEEGGGDAAVEWFSVVGGTRILINDTSNPLALLAYYQGPYRGPAYIKSVRPGVGVSLATTDPLASKIEVVIEDADTQSVPGSVKMKLNGSAVAVTQNKQGRTLTAAHAPAGGLPRGIHAVEVSYDHGSPAVTRTVAFTISIKPTPNDFASGFWIEAEDFDFDGGQTKPEASQMPYPGGAYEGLGAVKGVDYQNSDGNDSDQYRTETDANGENEINITGNLGGRWGSERPGGFTMTGNWRIGWVSDADWCNYTRTIPEGFYNVYAALSFDGTDPNQLRGTLYKVTAGVGTPNQTLERLGGFSANGSGGWGANDLVVMQAADGSDAIVKLGGKTTLRFNMGSGDFDYFFLTPAAGATTQAKSANPPPGGVANLNTKIEVELEDLNNQVVQASIRLVVDGQEVTGQASITQSRPITRISYTFPALLSPGSAHSYRVTWSDNATPPNPKELTVNFTAFPVGGAEMFVIEAEDYNSNGVARPEASVMPYLGGAYQDLPAFLGIDYNNSDANDSDVYRTTRNGGDDTAPNNVNITDNLGGQLGRARGLWDVTVNYRLGWVADGEWQNYTRTFPAGNYAVYAALSFDGRDPGQLRGSLARVTSDPKQPNQTTVPLGDFNAPGSGGWGRNDLVRMNANVQLEGTQTLRFNLGSGDFDYLLFVKETQQPAPTISVARDASGDLVLTFTGKLLRAERVTGPYLEVPGATSPRRVTPTAGGQSYWRASH